MSSNKHNIAAFKKAANFARAKGLFHSRDFEKARFPREYLRRLIQAGTVRQITRGLYEAHDFDPDENLTLLEAALVVPRGVVCFTSALLFHQIGTQWPRQVWLAVPRGSRFPRVKRPKVRFCEFSKEAYSHGIEEHKVAGGVVRVYSPAKTVADCFKYRNKYGLDVAVEAIREGWNERKFTLAELVEAAKICRVDKVIHPYIEMLP